MLFFCWLVPYASINTKHQTADHFRVQQGVMNLAEWQPDQINILKLDGEWEFYWNKLLSPADFHELTHAQLIRDREFQRVPAQWNGSNNTIGDPLPAYGMATYRMVLTNLPESGLYALKKSNIRFASRIYINGQLLLSDGLSADDTPSYQPGNRPQLGTFHAEAGSIEIIVHAANYDYINSGIVVSLLFGKEAALLEQQRMKMAREFGLLAILGTLTLFYIVSFLAAFAYRIRDYSLLILALICILVCVYHSLMGERLLYYMLERVSFETLYKLKDIISLVACIALAYFFQQRQESPLIRKVTQIVSAVLAIFALVVPFVSIKFYTDVQFHVVVMYQLLLFWLLARAAIRYVRFTDAVRWKPFLHFLSILLINLYAIDTILFAININNSQWLGQIYVIAFNIIMLFLIILRFFEAYTTIDEMKNELLRLDKLKDDFLSNTSHELRTPLNAIVNISESLLKGVDGQVNDAQAYNLAIVISSGRRLTKLVNELLDYYKLKHGDIALQQSDIDVRGYVETVLRMHRFLMANERTVLVNAVPEHLPPAYADGNRLVQILHNLIGNAVKFCEDGTVQVEAEAVDGWIEIRVSDTGDGIEPQMQERIFKDYEQGANSRASQYGGTGLGLSITKRLVELHGGTIRVQSSPGQGATFIFTLPAAAPNRDRTGIAPRGEQERIVTAILQGEFPLMINGAVHEPILVVDDDPANLQSMINLFKLEDRSIVVVNRGEMALEAVVRQDFFLVILDITMPGMSGFEVLRQIRERFSLFELPVLMVTARNRSEDIRMAMELGANDFVAKPFQSEELLARVRSLTKLKSSVKLARDAEIAFLRSQIKPHFLYNALTAIAEICVTDSRQAEEVTLQLSRYLRNSFDFKQLDSLTTLASELELVKSYVGIEKARFGTRLEVEYEVDADPRLLIPPLIIQPLVENAIRHGVMSHFDGGKVTITVKSHTAGDVTIRIVDNGCGMSPQKLSMVLNPASAEMGIGLWNIKQRLKLVYGRELRIESKEGEGTLIEVTLPAQVGTQGGA